MSELDEETRHELETTFFVDIQKWASENGIDMKDKEQVQSVLQALCNTCIRTAVYAGHQGFIVDGEVSTGMNATTRKVFAFVFETKEIEEYIQ